MFLLPRFGLFNALAVVLALLASPYVFASEISRIDTLIDTYGKALVIDVITDKRHGKVTILKNKTFRDARGRPDPELVTALTVAEDLKIIDMSIDSFTGELDKARELKAEEDSIQSVPNVADVPAEPLKSRELKAELDRTRNKLKHASTSYELSRLKREVRKLDRKYKQALYNEKHGTGNKQKRSSSSRKYSRYSAASCERAKEQLQQVTDTRYRHKMFFCKDRKYRQENPRTCSASSGNRYGYSRNYDINKHKEKVAKLRANVERSCK